MVEMIEMVRILNLVILWSLVILDEIGCGISIYDGVFFVWVIVEYLYDEVGC